MKQSRAFTLVELLAVIAILAVLASLLFPVFASARDSARLTACLSNFRQIGAASLLYQQDNDDRFMIPIYDPEEQVPAEANARWPQALQSYLRGWSTMDCPSDPHNLPPPTLFGGDGESFGTNYAEYEFDIAERVNAGFNFMYLSPLSRGPRGWTSQPRSSSDLADPSRVLAFVDSVWDLDLRGSPVGGGNFLVLPPCRFQHVGSTVIDSYSLPTNSEVFKANHGWGITSGRQFYGGAWGWHRGRASVMFTDGRAVSQPVRDLAQGCRSTTYSAGIIGDPTLYTWDLQ